MAKLFRLALMDVESTLFLSSEKREKKGKETISKELLLSLYKGVMTRRETAECELPPFVDWQPSSPAGKTILLSVSFLLPSVYYSFCSWSTSWSRLYLDDSRHIRLTHQSLIIPSTRAKDSERSLSIQFFTFVIIYIYLQRLISLENEHLMRISSYLSLFFSPSRDKFGLTRIKLVPFSWESITRAAWRSRSSRSDTNVILKLRVQLRCIFIV